MLHVESDSQLTSQPAIYALMPMQERLVQVKYFSDLFINSAGNHDPLLKEVYKSVCDSHSDKDKKIRLKTFQTFR